MEMVSMSSTSVLVASAISSASWSSPNSCSTTLSLWELINVIDNRGDGGDDKGRDIDYRI